MKKAILFFFLCYSTFLIRCNCVFAIPTEKSSTFLVTCATGELGGAIADLLAKENNLILTGRNTSKLEEISKKYAQNYPYIYQNVTLDYLNTSTNTLESILKSREKPISGLVIITPRPQHGSNLFQEGSAWQQLFQATFIGPAEVIKKVLPFLNQDGKIVIIGGTTSVQLLPEYGPACIIRRMWTTYAKALSHQLGPKGIHVNVLSPGVVLTQFHKDRVAKKAEANHLSYEEQLEKEVASIPLHRYTTPSEVAQSVKFLLNK